MKPIVAVRFQPSAPLGIAAEALNESRAPWKYLDVWDDDEWPDLERVSGLVVLGGEMNVDRIDDYPFLDRAKGLLADAVERDVPVLGICLGAQLLARALGARVWTLDTKEIGFIDISATPAGRDDPVLSPFAPMTPVFLFHEDALELPAGADLLFRGDVVQNQAFRYGRSAYGVQFHLEVTEKIISDWCDETPDLEGEWGVTKEQVMKEVAELLPAQQQAGKAAVKRFVELRLPQPPEPDSEPEG
ncbi:MAG: type 1 glutamine amidotransferase [Actinomycetota bacterium]|nr:type 1 glutamine amidotransferase [Actinomycetota bacterium]